jgi:hypothetical protein
MPRSRADERLLKRIQREAPEALDAKVDVERAVGRLLETQPESREARKAAKAKAAGRKK